MTGHLRMASAILVVVAGACKVESKAPAADTTSGTDPAVTSSAQVGTSSVVGARIDQRGTVVGMPIRSRFTASDTLPDVHDPHFARPFTTPEHVR